MRGGWLVLGLILYVQHGLAQYYFYDNLYLDKPVWIEAGAFVGGMNCVSDLGGGKRFISRTGVDWSNTLPALGLYVSVRLKEKGELSISALTGKVQASDKYADSPDRIRRNLHFQSSIRELAFGINLFPFTFFSIGSLRSMPYLSGGIGYFQFNPKANLNGDWIELQPLRTEGQGFREYPQRKSYKLQQVNVPIGIGWIWNLLGVHTIRLECLYRKLFTDYLDDVSTRYIIPTFYQWYLPSGGAAKAVLLMDRRGEREPTPPAQPGEKRGNPANNDGYWTISLKLGYVLNREKR